MVCGIHMNMDTAGVIDLGTDPFHPPHTLLESGEFWIGQLGGDQLHTKIFDVIFQILCSGPLLPNNAGVADQLPLLARGVLHFPGIIDAAFGFRYGPKVVRQRLSGLLTGDTGHLHFYAEALVFQAGHAASPIFRGSSSTARIRRPMASITVTVTLFPACL